MNTKLRRSVAALVTAFACLTLMASPASATTHPATVTGGNIELVSTGSTLNLPWAGTGGTGCGHTLVIDETTTAYEVTDYSSRTRGTFLGAFVAVVTRTASTAGTITGTTTLDTSSTLSLRIQFFTPANANPATDCATTGTVRCTYNVTLHLGGGVTGWTSSNTGTLSYPTQALTWGGGSCTVPFSTWLSGSVNAGGFSFYL